uniref:Uncharacterized protein n=1 Tax=Arundo donax TaxID=35708 RepID=A0A0A9GF38_ARUDO
MCIASSTLQTEAHGKEILKHGELSSSFWHLNTKHHDISIPATREIVVTIYINSYRTQDVAK